LVSLCRIVLGVEWTELYLIGGLQTVAGAPPKVWFISSRCCFVSKLERLKDQIFHFWRPLQQKLREGWVKFLSQYLEQLSAIIAACLDFPHFAPFRNQSASKATVVENW